MAQSDIPILPYSLPARNTSSATTAHAQAVQPRNFPQTLHFQRF